MGTRLTLSFHKKGNCYLKVQQHRSHQSLSLNCSSPLLSASPELGEVRGCQPHYLKLTVLLVRFAVGLLVSSIVPGGADI